MKKLVTYLLVAGMFLSTGCCTLGILFALFADQVEQRLQVKSKSIPAPVKAKTAPAGKTAKPAEPPVPKVEEPGEAEARAFLEERTIQVLFDRGKEPSNRWLDGAETVARKGRSYFEQAIMKLQDENHPLQRQQRLCETYLQLTPPEDVPDYMVKRLADCFMQVVDNTYARGKKKQRNVPSWSSFADRMSGLGPRAKMILQSLEKGKESKDAYEVESAFKAIAKISAPSR